MLGAVLYAANWRFILGHSAYAANYQAPSALLHYWSLAIEEQAYVVLPLLFVVLTAARRVDASLPRRRRRADARCRSPAALVIHDPNRAYFGTDTRSFELLAGAALALAIGFPGTTGTPAASGRVAGGLAVVGVVGTAVLWATVHETSSWLTKGGLWGVSGALVRACSSARCRAAGCHLRSRGRPLVALGRRSYGVYVYHWPLFLLVSAGTIGWHGLALDVARHRRDRRRGRGVVPVAGAADPAQDVAVAAAPAPTSSSSRRSSPARSSPPPSPGRRRPRRGRSLGRAIPSCSPPRPRPY